MITWEQIQPHLPAWAHTILLAGVRGSYAYGTVTPTTEDIDIFVITVQPVNHYIGLGSERWKSEQIEFEVDGKKVDCQIYDVKMFFSLLVKGNPNVHEYLNIPEELYLYKRNPYAQYIIRDRAWFRSRKVIAATMGYAGSLLKRMGEDRNGLGAKRRTLLKAHGYDLKDASHCYRLLVSLLESVKLDGLIVRIDEADLQIAIDLKIGKYTKEEAETLLTGRMKEVEETVFDWPGRPRADLVDYMLCDMTIRPLEYA